MFEVNNSWFRNGDRCIMMIIVVLIFILFYARYDSYFAKVFKIYTQLWKFQQENRQKLVEAGLKRWEIGDIASRIGQLYFGQYMKTSEASFLSESYIFYEAILTREYFKDGMFQDINIAFKQLRFLARFLTVCLVLSRREIVYQLVNQFKMLLDDCKRAFQVKFIKAFSLWFQPFSIYSKQRHINHGLFGNSCSILISLCFNMNSSFGLMCNVSIVITRNFFDMHFSSLEHLFIRYLVLLCSLVVVILCMCKHFSSKGLETDPFHFIYFEIDKSSLSSFLLHTDE